MQYPSKDFWGIFKSTNGALSTAEAIAIANLAAQAPQGTYLELGTFQGKSAMSALCGLKGEEDFWLLEPKFEDEQFMADVIGNMNRIKRLLKSDVLSFYLASYSTDFIPTLITNLSYVMVDSGSHQDGLPMQEAKLLEDRMVQGGIIVWHDFKNQFREPAEAAEYLVSTGKYDWVNINWQPIFNYVKEHNLEEGNSSWHVYPDLPHPPNFVGAVKRIS